MKRFLRLYVLYSLLATGVQAQLFPFKTYTTEDGLSSNAVYAVLRDEKGVLWTGTNFGISWYDGSAFVRPVLPARVNQVYVTSLFEDRQGTLWATTFYNGLYACSHGRFKNYMPDTIHLENQANSMFEMLELGKGLYLVGTDRNVYFFDKKRFTLFDPHNPQLAVQVNTMGQSSSGDIFIATTRGIQWYEKKKDRWVYRDHLLKNYQINKIIVRGDGCWLATDKGVLHFRKANGEAFDRPDEVFLAGENISTLCKGAGNDIWAGSTRAYKISNHRLTVYGAENGLPSATIHDVFYDRENIAWFATDNGLTKMTGEYYQFFPMSNGGDDINIISLGKDRWNDLWCGTFSGLWRMHNGQMKAFREIGHKPLGFVFFLLRDRRGRLWAGTDAGIITIERDHFTLHSSFVATRGYEDEEGRLWFGCQDGSVLCAYNGKVYSIIKSPPAHESITAVYCDPFHFLWLGYYTSGVRKYRLSGNAVTLVKSYSPANGYSNLRVRCSLPDGKGHILFGTRTSGVFVFPVDPDCTEPVYTIDTKKGLKGDWVKDMGTDTTGRILLCTNRGMDILRVQDYSHPVISTVSFTDPSVPAEDGAVLSYNHAYWIGTARGLICYEPQLQSGNKNPPIPLLTQVHVDGRPDSSFTIYEKQARPLHLPYFKNILDFSFVGTSLQDEKKVRYKYRLIGLDSTWSQPVARRYVNYSNLSPGHYRFEVMARNNDGLWSRAPAVYSFVIATPFWRTGWFIGLSILLVSAVLYGIYRYRLHQLLALERLRSRISTDLHDDIGSTLSSISILSDIALREKNRVFSAGMMQEIKDNSVSLMERMDDIVWSINPRNDSLESLLLRVKRFAVRLFEAGGIDYEIHIQPDIRQIGLPMEYRQHIYLVMKEAINNVVKYSGCTDAGISVHYRPPFLTVEIRDNGKGFDPDAPHTGNGLLNMQQRAAMLKADIRLETASGKGTTVTLITKIK